MQTYVVYGSRVDTVREVVMDISWNVAPVPTTVTFITYLIIAPFWSSTGGGFQVMTAEVDVEVAPLKFWGGLLGTE